ncbi:MAG: response regulator [Planctomycetia bacterium]
MIGSQTLMAEPIVSEGTGRRLYVVDDDANVLEVLRIMFTDAGYDVQSYVSAVQFVDEVPTLSPGVVVTDYRMGQVDGPEVQRRLLERQSDFRMILITAYPRTSLAVSAMKLGAVTVLDKPFDRVELLAAVREGFQQLQIAEREELTLPPLLPAGETYFSRLSLREKQVMQLVYEGDTNKGISIRLEISIKTVEKHRAKAMKKMKVTSIASLVRLMDRERDQL